VFEGGGEGVWEVDSGVRGWVGEELDRMGGGTCSLIRSAGRIRAL